MALFRTEAPLLSINAAVDEGLGVETSAGSKVLGSFVAHLNQEAQTFVTATSYTFFIAPYACEVVAAQAIWGTAGGAAATVQPFKDTGTNAPGAGTALTTAAFAINGTANTLAKATLATAPGTLQLAAGDRISAKFAGTLTGLASLSMMIQLKRI